MCYVPIWEPSAVVKAACLEGWRSWVQTPLYHPDYKETNVSSPLTLKDCGEPPRQRGRVRGCRETPARKIRILCLEGSVISFISPSSGGSPGPY